MPKKSEKTTKKKIRVLVFPVGKPPEEREIDGDLEGIYAITGSPMQVVPYLGGTVDLYCNEEGKLNGMPPNRSVWDGADIIFGDFFFARQDGENMGPITDDDIRSLKAEFASRGTRTFVDGVEAPFGTIDWSQGAT